MVRRALLTVGFITLVSGMWLTHATPAFANSIAGMNYSGDSYDFTAQSNSSRDALTFSADGQYMYLTSTASGNILYQYTLSTPWDITTATYTRSATFFTGMDGVKVSTDGTKLYIWDFYNRILREYTMTTPWSIASTTLTSSKGLSTGNNYAFTISNDGLMAYVVQSSSPYVVNQYTFGTAWDLSTLTTTATSTLTLGAADGAYIFGIEFSTDGTKMYTVRSSSSGGDPTFRQYTLSTPWRVSTATYDSISISLVSEDVTWMRGLARNPANGDLYTTGPSIGTRKVFRYSTSSPDITPPIVTMSLPANGTIVSGSSVTITATSTDNNGIAGVKFYVNDVQYGAEDTVSPYTTTWDSTTAATGSTTIYAVARDSNGLVATSTSISVSVENNPPTTPASSVVFTPAQTTMGLSWTRGDGTNRVVFMAATTTTDTAPAVNGTTYTANSTFGSGSQIGTTGWYAVYRGTGTSTTVTGLTASTTYRVHVVEYTGATGNQQYLTTTETGNPASQATLAYSAPTLPASNVAISTTTARISNISWTNGNGSAGRVVFMKQGTSGAAAPSNDTTYTANSAFGSGSQIGSTGWYAVYKGTSNSVAVTNIDHTLDYQVHVIEYNGTVGREAYLTTSTTTNPKTKSANTTRTIYANYATGNDTTGAGTAGAPYKTFHKAYTMAYDGDTIDLTGTFSWANADETGDSSTTGYTVAKAITIQGQKAGDTIIQAAASENTADRRVFTFGGSYPITVKNVTIRYGKTSAGGCFSGSVSILTVDGVDMYGCRSTSSGAAMTVTNGTTTIQNSSIRNNTSVASAGGVVVQSGANVFVSNTTFTGNVAATSSSGYTGGALYVSTGTVWLTNVTVTGNTSYRGAVANNGGHIFFRNSIVAGNTAASAALADADVYRNSGTLSSQGYNIIGRLTSASSYATSTGDWMDTDGNDTYTLHSVGSTGSLLLSGTATQDSTTGTYVHELQSGSIAVDGGLGTSYTASSSLVTVPTADQRGTARSATVDIGAYEYGAGGGDTTAPSISSVASSTTASTATITFSTNETATPTVSYGLTTGYGSATTTAVTGTSHSLTITGLTAATTYHFQVAATDTSSNASTSGDYTFTTAAAADTTAPSISSVASTTTTTTATITWTTNENASSTVRYGATSSYGSASTTQAYQTSQSIILTGLTAGTTYHFRVESSDVSGNLATSTDYTFTTSAAPDTTAPVISLVASSTTTTTATITWTTNENASSTVRYGATSSYGSASTTSTYQTSQSITLTGLTAGTTYHFRVESSDSSANLATSSDYTFTTASSVDSTAPTASTTAPIGGSTVNGMVTLSADAADNVGVAGVTFYINGVRIAAEDTSAPYTVTWDASATSTGSYSVRAVARDAAGNYGTSTAVTVTVSGTSAAPQSVAATSALYGATVTWSTEYAATSRVAFGLTTSLGSTTPEYDVLTRTTSHSVSLTGLPSCARFYYAVSGATVSGTYATSTTGTFTTRGCTGNATISGTQQGVITTGAGGTVTQDALTLTVPTSFTATTSAATFQAHKLEPSTFFATAGAPTGKARAGDTVFNLKALTDATTTLSTFAAPLTVTMTYSASDVSSLDESSLWIYRYDGSAWHPLQSCVVDTGLRTVTCETTSFSDFSIFGDAVVSASASRRSGGGFTLNSRIAFLREYGDASLIPQLQNQFGRATTSPSSARTSFTATLRPGMTHPEVRALQVFLNANGYAVAVTGPGSPGNETNYFGAMTARAVMQYQAAHAAHILAPAGLVTPTGIVGPMTRAQLNRVP